MKLEPVSLVHAEAVQRLAADPDVVAMTNLPDPYPPRGAEDWIRHVMPRHAAGLEYAFAMLAAPGAPEDGVQVVGVGGLVDVQADEVELGYWVGRPYWNRGYATAACTQLLAFAFDHLHVRRVRARTLLRNRASRQVLAKLGFAQEGVTTNQYPKWHPLDYLATYVLTAAQWYARHAPA